MRYQPLDALQRDSYVAPGWTARGLKRMTRYYSRLRWLEHIPYDDYDPDVPEGQLPLWQKQEKEMSHEALHWHELATV